jgi:hypothetical protein
MAEMEDKINSILSDPKMMERIMSMAQALGANQPESEGPKEAKNALPPFPDIDMATMQRISGLARQSGIDKREQSLLRALGGYLSKDRINRLERAMRAAKMAKIATSALGQRGISSYQGR